MLTLIRWDKLTIRGIRTVFGMENSVCELMKSRSTSSRNEPVLSDRNGADSCDGRHIVKDRTVAVLIS